MDNQVCISEHPLAVVYGSAGRAGSESPAEEKADQSAAQDLPVTGEERQSARLHLILLRPW